MSLDLKDAKIISDILKWDNTKSKPDEIDVIWFSPPCTEYSRAKTNRSQKNKVCK